MYFMLSHMSEEEVFTNCCFCLGFTVELESVCVFLLHVFLCFSHLLAFGFCLAEVLVFRSISQIPFKHLVRSDYCFLFGDTPLYG